MRNGLIFGGHGQLGSDILEVMNDWEWVSPERKVLDVSNLKQLQQFLEKLNPLPKIIINCTALTNTTLCEQNINEAFSVNTFPLKVLSDFCLDKNIKLIQISTDYVFDGNISGSYSESDSPSPINIYGLSKHAGERLILSKLQNFLILRVSSLYGIKGASGKGGNFVETMISKAKSGEELKVVDDQFMSPTHTYEIAMFIRKLLEGNLQASGIYHFGGKGKCSWFEFAAEIFTQLNIKANLQGVKVTDFNAALKRPRNSSLNCEKADKIYKMKNWQNSLNDYLKRKGHLK
jgi:dTDP-4-dehydrorhamnose reductase